jgi:hypothetical protein
MDWYQLETFIDENGSDPPREASWEGSGDFKEVTFTVVG